MEISGVISALVVGVVIGVLGRLVVPGRQHIGILWTVVVGIAAALLGTALARATGLAHTSGPDWTEWAAQVLLAALGVAALTRVKALDRSRPPSAAPFAPFGGRAPGNTGRKKATARPSESGAERRSAAEEPGEKNNRSSGGGPRRRTPSHREEKQ